MQSVIEFISTYSWSFLILIVLIAVITVFVLTKGANTYSQSYCYISPGINCQNIILMSNGTGSKATLIFINELGTDISTASNSFLLTSLFVNGSSEGACYPSYVPNGGVGICNTTMPGYSPSTGSQVALSFALRYEICSKAVCGPDLYSTSGTGTAFTTPYHDISMKVTLLTTPTGANVVVQGVPYTSNTQLDMLQGLHYNLYAQSIPGYTFTGWSASSSNITILNVNSQSTSGYALGNGQITASYTQTSPTSKSTTSVTTTIIPGALYLPAPTPSSQSVTQGSVATIADSGATGGTSPYTYQWLEEAPGATSFTDAADCASPTSTTCSFSTTGSTAAGTYQFELKVTDSESPPLTITSSSASVTVLQCYQLTLSGTGGTESANPTSSGGCTSGSYSAGSSVSITATPSSGYVLNSWTGSGTGSYSGSSNPATVTMDSAITETANYAACYSLTLSGSGGTESASPISSGGCPSSEYTSGTSVSITATPDSGATFSSWTGSGTGSYSGSSNPATITTNSVITESAYYIYPISYGGANSCTAACSGVSATSTSFSTYFCAQGNWAPDAETTSFTNDVTYNTNNIGSVGHQTSSTCTVSTATDEAMSIIGLSNVGSFSVINSPTTGSGSISSSFTLSQTTFVLIGVACANEECSVVTIPSGCTAQTSQGVGSSTAYGTSYFAVCPALASGSYSVSVTGSGSDDVITVYTLNPISSLSIPAPSPSAQYVDQGQTATITDSGATGGTSPYTYQWLEKAPGATSFTGATNCAAPTTTTCTFATSTSTTAGVYYFELQATTSGSPAISGISLSTAAVYVNSVLSIAAPSPSSQSIAQGSVATITDSGATGGTSPYSYQWLEEAPGATSFTNAVDCASPTSTTCSFSTTTSTVTGTYQFELKTTDSATTPTSVTSSAVSVTVITQIPYGGANSCTAACSGVSATSTSFSTYFCAQGNWAPDAETTSFTNDVTYNTNNIGSVGHQTSSTCTVSTATDEAMSIIGLSNVGSFSVINSPTTGSGSISSSFTLSQTTFVLIGVACANEECSVVTIPSGCTAQTSQGVGSSTAYGTSYFAVCPALASGSYSVSVTGSGSDDVIAVYAVNPA